MWQPNVFIGDHHPTSTKCLAKSFLTAWSKKLSIPFLTFFLFVSFTKRHFLCLVSDWKSTAAGKLRQLSSSWCSKADATTAVASNSINSVHNRFAHTAVSIYRDGHMRDIFMPALYPVPFDGVKGINVVACRNKKLVCLPAGWWVSFIRIHLIHQALSELCCHP